MIQKCRGWDLKIPTRTSWDIVMLQQAAWVALCYLFRTYRCPGQIQNNWTLNVFCGTDDIFTSPAGTLWAKYCLLSDVDEKVYLYFKFQKMWMTTSVNGLVPERSSPILLKWAIKPHITLLASKGKSQPRTSSNGGEKNLHLQCLLIHKYMRKIMNLGVQENFCNLFCSIKIKWIMQISANASQKSNE